MLLKIDHKTNLSGRIHVELHVLNFSCCNAAAVFLQEVERTADQAALILSNSATLHNLALTFEGDGPSGVTLHFLGRAWGPCKGRGLQLAKRLLCEVALQELRAKLWTMRVVPAPDFEVSRSGASAQNTHLGPDNLGHKLLLKMGWKGKGQGLGKEEQGRAEPPGLDVTVIRRAGIGHSDGGSAAFREYVRGRLHQFLSDPKVSEQSLGPDCRGL